jgi:3-isopropylmalate/(R)-2-methylmalate dehydratase small subunit
MQAFKPVTSHVIPLDINNVDTDMIIPAQFLTKINLDGYGEYLFQGLRERDKNFVFNNPKYQTSEILLARQNFGCGSSREHAVWAIKQTRLSHPKPLESSISGARSAIIIYPFGICTSTTH